MRNNVSYAEITCDICGKVEHIATTLILPEGWGKVSVGYESWDACDECKKRINETIRNMKEERKDEQTEPDMDEYYQDHPENYDCPWK